MSADSEPVVMDVPQTDEVPAWVLVGLCGMMSCRTAVWLMWLLNALGVALAAAGFLTQSYKSFWYGLLAFAAALWTGAAIRWVDRHAQWRDE